METSEQFTCISYNKVDFLIPCSYVVAGLYLNVDKDAKNVTYNRETLPHIHIGEFLEKIFLCKPVYDAGVVLVMKTQDFVRDVCVDVNDYTDTAFPHSGYLAISVNSDIVSKSIAYSDLRLMPNSIRTRMNDYGICAIRFPEGNRKQILISPDMLLRRFFAEVKK